MSKERRIFNPEIKVTVLKSYLVDKFPVSELRKKAKSRVSAEPILSLREVNSFFL